MRVLVAIANFGTKNARYLNTLLSEYRSMTKYNVDIVVLSNIPKDLGSTVEVIVGLPAKDPWSLPFAHKALFAERMQQYDLFIYSEDDTLITEQNINAFVQATHILPDQYIAGFIRYEISPEGKKYYSTMHAHYHWDPKSVLKFGEYIFAHYTNEHSACYILTRRQLEKAIDSRGFLLPPRKGRYDMLVTAATDPYTQCGMKKLVCISHLNDFCLHHLPNVYCGRIGLDAEWADREIEKLLSLNDTMTNCGPLFDTNTLLEDPELSKKYHEPCREDILSLIPQDVRSILSVGCGCGSTESELTKRGIEVYGIPLDFVVQASSTARGIKNLSPSFEIAREELRGIYFDCILFSDVLQYLPNPILMLKEFINLLSEDGSIIISVLNFNHPSILKKRIQGKLPIRMDEGNLSFKKYKIHFTTKHMLYFWLESSGLRVRQSCRNIEQRHEFLNSITLGMLKSSLSRNIVVLVQPAKT